MPEFLPSKQLFGRSLRETYFLFLILCSLTVSFRLITACIAGHPIQPEVAFYLRFFIETTIGLSVMFCILYLRHNKKKLFTADDKLIVQCGRKSYCAFWKDIVRLRFIKGGDGKVCRIHVFQGGKNKRFDVAEFHEMDALARVLAERVPRECIIETKAKSLDWNHPVRLSLLLLFLSGMSAAAIAILANVVFG